MVDQSEQQAVPVAQELLPCPFCGGEADLYRPAMSKWCHVECDACGCQTEPYHDNTAAAAAAAVTAWNSRALSPQTLRAPGEEWTIDLDRREIYFGNQMLFKVYSCDDFWHVEGEAAKDRQWFDEQAKAAVLTLNALATVAAANDEGVAEAIKALEAIAASAEVRIQDGQDMGVRIWRIALEDIVRDARAAIRLLSQGEGE